MPAVYNIAGAPRVLHGWRKEHADPRDRLYVTESAAMSSVDLRRYCTRIENQASLGSCVGNAVTSAMETYALQLHQPIPELSRLFLYYFARILGHFPTDADTGCHIRDAMKVARFVGVSEEDRWSYDIAKFSKQPEYNALKSARQYHINAYYRCNSVNSICGSLNSGYTVVGGFSVPEEMYSDEVTASGIIPIPGPDSKFVGGHAVHFVGYDHTRRMLLFQNSWGKDWGEEGFGWLPYAYVDGGFAGDFWTIRDE